MNNEKLSLDPRIDRLLHENVISEYQPQFNKEQLCTFEVFQKVKPNKPFEHVGIVHADDLEIAFLFAKEQYTRRGNENSAMSIVPTQAIFVSDYTEADQNAFDLFNNAEVSHPDQEELVTFEIFTLKKRGKQHTYCCSVEANSAESALAIAGKLHYQNPCLNLWAIPRSAFLVSESDETDIWKTLPEKKYREAIAYKSADKIAKYKAS